MSETTLISRVFSGKLRNEIKCPNCNNVSRTYNYYHDISLDMMRMKGNTPTVSDMISSFIRPEVLTKGNEWLCDKCKKRVQVIITF